MDDKDTQENPSSDFNKLDLNQLQDFSFGTQWTQDKSAPADKQQRSSRPRGDDRGEPRRDRRSFRKPAGGPGGDGKGGGAPRREHSGDRRPRRDFQGGGQGERRFGGRRDQQFQGPYDSPHFSTSFYPEDDSFNALAKTIRASCRTIELFEIAKTVVDKNDRFIVVMTRKPSGEGKDKRPLYISLADGLPFESEAEVVNHVMANHLDRFFDAEEVEVDAPTGNFQVINKCGVTGVLLGPPNYHRYNEFVQQHFASQIKGMSLEAFRNRIESVRDPEVVTQWTEQMKKVVRYTWKSADAPKPAKVEAAKPAEPETKETTPEASAEVEASPEVESTPETTETPVVENTAEAPAATEEAAPSEETSAVEETPAPAAEESAPEAEAPDALTFDSIEDARIHLLTTSHDKIVKTVETVRFHGRLLETLPDGEIRRSVEGSLERQRRFPLDTANGLRGRLRREHFTIFKKGSKGVSYVCAVKRKFRTPGQTFADSIGDLISFIESNPMVKVSELTSKFVGIESPAPVVTATEGEGAEPKPAPEAAELTVEQKAKIARMQGDLRWLVMEGYVTEFIDGRLFAAPPIPESKKRAAETTEHDATNFPEAPAAEVEKNTAEAAPTEPKVVEEPKQEAAPAEAPAPEEASAPEDTAKSEDAPVSEEAATPEVVAEPEKEVAPPAPDVPAAAETTPEETSDGEAPPKKD